MNLRCLLVDDNAAFLEAASRLIRREGMTIVAVASNGAEALRLVRDLHPDIVLIDIGLGDESGFDIAELLAREAGTRAVSIMISARGEPDYVDLIAQSPAAGFLAKPEPSALGIARVLSRAF